MSPLKILLSSLVVLAFMEARTDREEGSLNKPLQKRKLIEFYQVNYFRFSFNSLHQYNRFLFRGHF